MSNTVNAFLHLATQIPPPVDVSALCHLASDLLKTQIRVVAVNFPSALPATIVREEHNTFGILYRPSDNWSSVQISILHELAHILLGHYHHMPVCQLLSEDYYTDEQQWEAEIVAYQIMTMITLQPSNEENPVTIRFANAMPQRKKNAVPDSDLANFQTAAKLKMFTEG